MSTSQLTQDEANALFSAEKYRTDEREWEYLCTSGALAIPLVSADKRETFTLDLSRGRIDISRGKYQNRARQVIVLARLDFGGRPHGNPDGEAIPHLHLYCEHYGDKWACTPPPERFPNLDDLWGTLHHFMAYCNVVDPPAFRRGLFS